jgi:hypothetical protein
MTRRSSRISRPPSPVEQFQRTTLKDDLQGLSHLTQCICLDYGKTLAVVGFSSGFIDNPYDFERSKDSNEMEQLFKYNHINNVPVKKASVIVNMMTSLRNSRNTIVNGKRIASLFMRCGYNYGAYVYQMIYGTGNYNAGGVQLAIAGFSTGYTYARDRLTEKPKYPKDLRDIMLDKLQQNNQPCWYLESLGLTDESRIILGTSNTMNKLVKDKDYIMKIYWIHGFNTGYQFSCRL